MPITSVEFAELKLQLTAILNQFHDDLTSMQQTVIDNTAYPLDYTYLAYACQTADLQKALVELEELLASTADTETLVAAFKLLTERRSKALLDTALSPFVNPDTPANQCYLALIGKLCVDAKPSDYFSFFVSPVTQVMWLEDDAEESIPGRRLSPATINLTVTAKPLTALDDTAEPLLANLALNDCIIIGEQIWLVPQFIYNKTIYLQKIHHLLTEKYPEFYVKLRAHHSSLETLYAPVQGIQQSIRTEIERLRQILIPAGRKFTNQVYASDDTWVAVMQFKQFIDHLPAELMQSIKEMSSVDNKSLISIIENDLIRNRDCVEIAAENLFKILNNRANDLILDSSPKPSTEPLPSQVPLINIDTKNACKILIMEYVDATLDSQQFNLNQFCQMLMMFDSSLYPMICRRSELQRLLRSDHELVYVMAWLNYSQMSMFIKIVRIHLPECLNTLFAINRIMNSIDSRLRANLQHAMAKEIHESIMTIAETIENPEMLAKVLNEYNSFLQGEIIQCLLPRMPTIFHAAYPLEFFIEKLAISNISVVLKVMLQHYPSLFSGVDNFFHLLSKLAPTSCEAVTIGFKKQLLEAREKYGSAALIEEMVKCLEADKALLMMSVIEMELFSAAESLGEILAKLPQDKWPLVFQAFHQSELASIDSIERLANILNHLSPLQLQEMIRAWPKTSFGQIVPLTISLIINCLNPNLIVVLLQEKRVRDIFQERRDIGFLVSQVSAEMCDIILQVYSEMIIKFISDIDDLHDMFVWKDMFLQLPLRAIEVDAVIDPRDDFMIESELKLTMEKRAQILLAFKDHLIKLLRNEQDVGALLAYLIPAPCQKYNEPEPYTPCAIPVLLNAVIARLKLRSMDEDVYVDTTSDSMELLTISIDGIFIDNKAIVSILQKLSPQQRIILMNAPEFKPYLKEVFQSPAILAEALSLCHAGDIHAVMEICNIIPQLMTTPMDVAALLKGIDAHSESDLQTKLMLILTAIVDSLPQIFNLAPAPDDCNTPKSKVEFLLNQYVETIKIKYAKYNGQAHATFFTRNTLPVTITTDSPIQQFMALYHDHEPQMRQETEAMILLRLGQH